MKLTWYGHSCFKLENDSTSVVFDPYAPGSVPGCTLPEISADAVLCSHGHGDHSFADGVKLTGKAPSFGLVQVSTFHDDALGKKRGNNVVSVVEMDGMRVCHLGDLGHELTAQQISAIGKVDVLLIPVGGYYTIGASTAAKVVSSLSPRIVVPMHYRGDGFGYDVIGPVDDFLEYSDDVRYINGNSIEISVQSYEMTAVLAFTNS